MQKIYIYIIKIIKKKEKEKEYLIDYVNLPRLCFRIKIYVLGNKEDGDRINT